MMESYVISENLYKGYEGMEKITLILFKQKLERISSCSHKAPLTSEMFSLVGDQKPCLQTRLSPQVFFHHTR